MIKKITNILFIAATVVFVFACTGKKDASEQLEFAVVSIADSIENYSHDTTKSNDIKISYYSLKGEPQALADKHRADILDYLSSCLSQEGKIEDLTEENLPNYISKEIQSFNKLVDTDSMYLDCVTCRHAEFLLSATDAFQNSKIVSLLYFEHTYAGGAHGLFNYICYNYKKEDASAITLNDLSPNIDELIKRGEKAFVEQNGELSEYWFDEGFFLPENFSFTSEGLLFSYNLYEIAPYVQGIIELTLKKEDIKDIVPFFD